MRKQYKKPCSERMMALIISFILLGSGLGIGMYFKVQGRVESPPLQAYAKTPYPQSTIQEDFRVDENFTTHLPIVVLDTKGQTIKAGRMWDANTQTYVTIEEDPHIRGELEIIDNGDELNHLQDEPSLTSDIKIRLRGNSSITFDKKQYFIKLVDEEGNKQEQDVMGMGKEWEWILNISFADRSLIRNYLGLSLAREVMPYVSDARYCEVVMKDGDTYTYQGVYLMMESVKRGENRVAIDKYDPGDQALNYILRRDRYHKNDVMLDTYATREKLTREYVELKYPKDVTTRYLEAIEADISKLEESLFSNEPEQYYKYKELIDEQSFIDYFIINEFFAVGDAGLYSTYMYKDRGSKLHIGPVWDFDGALDNYLFEKLNPETLIMDSKPWFRQLLRDSGFVTKVIKRYETLRQTILSEAYLNQYIDQLVTYLGPAQARDWERWNALYIRNYLGRLPDGQENAPASYKEEIEKMKQIIHQHGTWLDDNLDTLYQYVEFKPEDFEEGWVSQIGRVLFGDSKKQKIGGLLAVMFIAVFSISIILVKRE